MSPLVNGTRWDHRPRTTVAALVDAWCPSPQGIAVARNGTVVPKSRWREVILEADNTLEIVTAAAGG